MQYRSIAVRGQWVTTSDKKLFGSRTREDPSTVDLEDFAARIASACGDLGRGGYEVISILPVARGSWTGETTPTSPTFAAIVTGRMP